MSTYADIAGVVTLDANAAAVFRTTVSWQWCQPVADGLMLSRAGDGSLTLDFGAACYRNWCRWICEDLYHSQQEGSVTGTVTIECSDGSNWRRVARFDDTTCSVGHEDCFALPILLERATMLEISIPMGDPLEFLVGAGEAQGVDAGAPQMGLCGCGGWDDDTDQPRCATVSCE
jgi:hypothetical protein